MLDNAARANNCNKKADRIEIMFKHIVTYGVTGMKTIGWIRLGDKASCGGVVAGDVADRSCAYWSRLARAQPWVHEKMACRCSSLKAPMRISLRK